MIGDTKDIPSQDLPELTAEEWALLHTACGVYMDAIHIKLTEGPAWSEQVRKEFKDLRERVRHVQARLPILPKE